ncbi:MAG: DNA gyrase subunit A [Alphaproteobacteria bacterium]|nr:DNA gyrase subunit A [Alphaproteobacteria bacterium]
MTDTPPPQQQDIAPVTIEEEMKRSYLGYAMSVIVSRALPDARDGLKPVHRRILFSMHEQGYGSDKPYRKSARVVGDVMGKYHPHGDQAIYDAMVRMVQDFSMRLPLLDGQGNFGSMDGDPAAAMRYTEIRMAKPAEALLGDIDEGTVDFEPNYDDTTEEPSVLPARFPNLLVNGAGGIAVGMATNIPPHNLGEIVDACIALVDDPGAGVERLMELVAGPDFPTGGVILGRAGIRSAFMTGRGSIVMRGKTHVEEVRKDREAIIVTEIPYQVNKASMIEKIADAVRAKRIEGISDLRDESDRDGVRVVIELKREAMAEVVLNQLYRYSPLQSSFGVNMLALDGRKPELMNLKQLVAAFVDFREEVITRRTRHRLGKARERAHVLVGLAIAVANIDEMIRLIRAAPDPQTAREQLTGRDWPAADVAALIALIDDPGRVAAEGYYRLSEAQARAILDLRLQRLTALGRDEIGDELKSIAAEITDHLETLSSRPKLLGILKAELLEMRERFATPRRTVIEELEFETDVEDLIQREDMVVTVSHAGYVKRTPLSTYRPQRRGGKGRTGMATRDEDFVTRVFVANTHQPVLFFSNIGRVYKLKVYRLPEAAPQSRGKAFINLLPLQQGERIQAVMPLPENEESWGGMYACFATAKGNVRRNALSDFTDVKANGKIAMKFEGDDADDRLVEVLPCTESDDILLNARRGKSIRFSVADLRVFQSRSSVGVRGMRLAAGDEVISMAILRHMEATPEERRAYLKYAAQQRRLLGGEEVDAEAPASDEDEERGEEDVLLSQDRLAELAAAEQFVLTVTDRGFGKRTSSYEYRQTGRGGLGINNIRTGERNGDVVAAFAVEEQDQIMMVTAGGQMIRCPVDDIRIAGRGTGGVTLLRTAEGEKVVSVARLGDGAGGEDESGDDAEPEGGEQAPE